MNNIAEVRTMQRQSPTWKKVSRNDAECVRPLHVAQIPQTPFEQRITDLLRSPQPELDDEKSSENNTSTG